jgi:hypothetical protein
MVQHSSDFSGRALLRPCGEPVIGSAYRLGGGPFDVEQCVSS